MVSKPRGGPAAVKVGQPSKDLDAKWCPAPPGDAPEWCGGRTGKQRAIAGLSRVVAIGCPSPGKAVRVGGKSDGSE